MNGWKVDNAQTAEISRSFFRHDPQPCRVVQLRHEGGDWMTVSRFHDEDVWLADSYVRANGFPVFSHGMGDRSCSKQVVAAYVAGWLDSLDWAS